MLQATTNRLHRRKRLQAVIEKILESEYESVAQTSVFVLGVHAELGGEFSESGPGVEFLETAAAAAALVGRTVGALVGGSPESHQLIETVAHAGERAGNTVNETDGETGIVAFAFVPTDDSVGDFVHGKENIAEGATQLAGGRVLGSRRSLNVGISRSGNGQENCRKE